MPLPRPDRSFHFRDGTPFPICARCTGELAGILAGLATWWAVHPPAGVAAVLLVPLIADGLLQLCTPYESGNLRRLATGLLFGYGLTVLLLTSLGLGLSMGLWLWENIAGSLRRSAAVTSRRQDHAGTVF